MVVFGSTLYTLFAKAVIALAGVYITWQSGKAARRRGLRSLWIVALGMFLVTLGCLVVDPLAAAAGVSPMVAQNVGYTGVGVGLLAVVYSLRTRAP